MTGTRTGHETADARAPLTLVWDWPLRAWHWLLALCVTGSLTTGLLGDITLMEWHMRLGYAALALLGFRLGWALWGGRYARWHTFALTPRRFAGFLRGRGHDWARTAPGAVLTLSMLAAIAFQAGTGLFTSDDIFTDGPLVRRASSDTVSTLSSLHRQAYWGILALIGLHLSAHLVYALRRDPTPLGMFTGRKPYAGAPTRHLWLRGLVTAVAAAAAVWWALPRI